MKNWKCCNIGKVYVRNNKGKQTFKKISSFTTKKVTPGLGVAVES